ncbi:MAG: CARDB domain-containing protein [Candidatus Bathyarchaeia archaeon]
MARARINATEIPDVAVEPNGTITYLTDFMRILETAHLGEATIYAGAFTAPIRLGGVPYCPEIETNLTITPAEAHDVAVASIVIQSSSVYKGTVVDIDVTVTNLGDFVESFNVTVFYDSFVVGELFVDGLASGVEEVLAFHWDTSGVGEGNYTISAEADRVVGEENVDNNLYVDSVVTILEARPNLLVPGWLPCLLLLLLIVLAALLLILLIIRRRKDKRARDSFHSGWTAWYERRPLS